MPKLALYMTARGEGITSIRVKDEFYAFKVQCTSCREVHVNPIHVSLEEQVELPSSRGTANFMMKCRVCARESSISISEPASYSPPDRLRILTIESRGCEPIEFVPEQFIATGSGKRGTKFDDVELSDEWFDYDDETKCEVSITDIAFDIARL